MNDTDFTEFPKMARLSRECVIQEKIDGTNACILIVPAHADTPKAIAAWFDEETRTDTVLMAGSRTRWITPHDDNFGFAQWCADHIEELKTLVPGRHFGEWWGSGIQRGYGLQKGEKRLSFFNTSRFCIHDQSEEGKIMLPPCIGLVPVLRQGIFTTSMVDSALHELRERGSLAAPGFMNPEGLVVFHTAANMGFKKTIFKDEEPKSRLQQ